MTKSLLIIINGAPCTGKTTLGRKLAKQLRLPFLSKDGIKEVLFDTLGWEDKEFRVGLIHASWALFQRTCEAESYFIIESPSHDRITW